MTTKYKTNLKLISASLLAGMGLMTSQTASADTYTIQYGDSFYSIAQKYQMDFYQLALNNGLTIDSLIFPGQTLQVPNQTLQASDLTTQTPLLDQTIPSGYYLDGYDYEIGGTYPIGQCTWGVKTLADWAGNWWGNANDWAVNAANQGFAVGYVPAVGSIMVWSDGGFGHVAYVTNVSEDGLVQVLEANYNGQQWIDNYRGWFNPLNSGTPGTVSYIYPPTN